MSTVVPPAGRQRPIRRNLRHHLGRHRALTCTNHPHYPSSCGKILLKKISRPYLGKMRARVMDRKSTAHQSGLRRRLNATVPSLHLCYPYLAQWQARYLRLSVGVVLAALVGIARTLVVHQVSRVSTSRRKSQHRQDTSSLGGRLKTTRCSVIIVLVLLRQCIRSPVEVLRCSPLGHRR